MVENQIEPMQLASVRVSPIPKGLKAPFPRRLFWVAWLLLLVLQHHLNVGLG